MSKAREMLPGEYGLLDEFLYQAIHTEPDEPRPPRCRSRFSAPTLPRTSTSGSASGRSPATTGRP